MIDRDDVEQALEIAVGRDIGHDLSSRRTASQRGIDVTRAALRRFIEELPPETMVHEILEALGDEHAY